MDTAYKVELDQFHGPLDLLLYLIKSQEIDIHDIPVSRVADQYLGHLETLAMLDINVASDFLVLAATLVELKSKVLLPVEAADEDEIEEVEDPRSDLVRKLLEYKRFRDLAERLEHLREENQARYSRGRSLMRAEAGDEEDDEDDDPGLEASLWDLLAAFQKLMREVARSAPQTIVYDDTPISVHMQRLLALFGERRVARFIELFDGRRDRGYIIGTFLALLELCKLEALRVEDGEGFDLMIRFVGSDHLAADMDFVTTYEQPASVLEQREPATEAEALAESSREDEGQLGVLDGDDDPTSEELPWSQWNEEPEDGDDDDRAAEAPNESHELH